MIQYHHIYIIVYPNIIICTLCPFEQKDAPLSQRFRLRDFLESMIDPQIPAIVIHIVYELSSRMRFGKRIELPQYRRIPVKGSIFIYI